MPFSFDLSQIPYNYTVEVINRFTGLDPVDREPKDFGGRFIALYRRQ